ncbi:MAG: efflux RND transporter periplasmic adaptor subunit [Candidatus Marinimicrobia bacterium]|nr:efflux RND transporter periplasmic adaptor subunit [Candidatus Neomarinimicrobiota bacterium]
MRISFNHVFKTIISLMIVVLVQSCSEEAREFDAQGNFETEEIHVSARESGILLWSTFKEGEKLFRGDTVGLIDTMMFHLIKAQLLAQRDLIDFKHRSVDAEKAVLHARLKPLLNDLKRLEALYESDVATQQELDHLQGNVETLKKQLEALDVKEESIRHEKDVLDKQIQQIDLHLRQCYIINPVSGTLITRYVQPGELIQPGRYLYTIAPLNPLTLRAYISGNQLSEISIGDTVTVLTDSTNGYQTHQGIVRWISSEAEFTPRQIQTREERVDLVYAIRIDVPNPDGVLKTGMPAEVIF